MKYYKDSYNNFLQVFDDTKVDLTRYVEITKEQYNAGIQNVLQSSNNLTNTYIEKLNQIKALKQQLSKTDYQAIKYAEGLLTEEEYLPIKQQRQAWRNQINALEEQLKEQ